MTAFVFILSLLLSFLLSGLETAIWSVSRVRVRHAADDDNVKAQELLKLLDDRDGVLGALTVANHIANVTAFGFISWLLVHLLGDWGYVTAFVLALPIFIIGLEVIPKGLFRRYPFRLLLRFLPVVQVIAKFRGIFRPIRQLHLDTPEEQDAARAARGDISRLMEQMTANGELRASATEIISRVLSSRPLKAADVMIPLSEALILPANSTAEAARDAASGRGVSSLLVSDRNHALGFVGTVECAALPAVLPPDRLVIQHARPVDHVDTSMAALLVLQRMRRRGATLILITSGGNIQPVGVVTEDAIINRLLQDGTAAPTDAASASS
jgi:CBS domain containing-hemolysin-like protein